MEQGAPCSILVLYLATASTRHAPHWGYGWGYREMHAPHWGMVGGVARVCTSLGYGWGCCEGVHLEGQYRQASLPQFVHLKARTGRVRAWEYHGHGCHEQGASRAHQGAVGGTTSCLLAEHEKHERHERHEGKENGKRGSGEEEGGKCQRSVPGVQGWGGAHLALFNGTDAVDAGRRIRKRDENKSVRGE